MATFDPFQVLGLARGYSVDPGELQRRYLERAAGVHPDAAAEDEAERRTAELNEARRVLEDPERRAVALWRLLGGVEDRALPAGFLAEMMGVREEMEADADRAKWDAWVTQRRGEHERRIGELFGRVEAGGSKDELLRAIKLELNAWRYTERLAEQIS